MISKRDEQCCGSDQQEDGGGDKQQEEWQPRTISDEEFKAAVEYVLAKLGPALKALADRDKGIDNECPDDA